MDRRAGGGVCEQNLVLIFSQGIKEQPFQISIPILPFTHRRDKLLMGYGKAMVFTCLVCAWFVFTHRFGIYSLCTLLIVMGIALLFDLRRNIIFLRGIIVEADNICIEYMHYNDLKSIKVIPGDVDVKIKTIPTRSKANYRIVLKAGDLKIRADDTFHWNIEDMRIIYERIKVAQGHNFSEKEKLMLARFDVIIERRKHKLLRNRS